MNLTNIVLPNIIFQIPSLEDSSYRKISIWKAPFIGLEKICDIILYPIKWVANLFKKASSTTFSLPSSPLLDRVQLQTISHFGKIASVASSLLVLYMSYSLFSSKAATPASSSPSTFQIPAIAVSFVCIAILGCYKANRYVAKNSAPSPKPPSHASALSQTKEPISISHLREQRVALQKKLTESGLIDDYLNIQINCLHEFKGDYQTYQKCIEDLKNPADLIKDMLINLSNVSEQDFAKYKDSCWSLLASVVHANAVSQPGETSLHKLATLQTQNLNIDPISAQVDTYIQNSFEKMGFKDFYEKTQTEYINTNVLAGGLAAYRSNLARLQKSKNKFVQQIIPQLNAHLDQAKEPLSNQYWELLYKLEGCFHDPFA